MSHIELAATLGKLSGNLPELSDAVSDAQKAFDKATASVQFHQREIEKYGTNTTRGRQAAEALGGAQDRLAIATGNLDEASRRYSQTLSALNIGRAMLSGEFRQGIDLLRRDGQEAGIAAGMMKQLGEMTNFAAKAKQNFNASSLIVERPENVQEYLDRQLQQIELQSEFNDRKREQLKAEQEIRALGGGDADIRMARERAGAEYDALQAQRERNKQAKSDEAQGKKTASQQESINHKLANLKQQAELAAGSTQELNREQAMLRAEQSLGISASAAQIQQARDYAAATWEAANAIKVRQQAEQGTKFAKQEIASTQATVDPATGEAVDPLAQINLQEQQKLEALAKYQEIDKQNAQLYEDAKTAIQKNASMQRREIADQEAERQQQNMSQLLGATSQFFDQMAGALGDYAGESSAAYKALYAVSKGFAIAQAESPRV